MKLLTEELKKKIPPLYSTEEVPFKDKVFICKFFTPWSNWTWYCVEGEPAEGGDFLFYGFVEGLEKEWGYFTLKELESVTGPGGLKIERDLHFENVPARKILNIE